MKKLKLFFALFAMLALNVGNVWGAEEATLTFTKACGGAGTDSKGNTWTVTSDAAESSYDATKGIHYGTGSKAVSYLQLSTSSISGTITKVEVNASGASSTAAKLNVTVGGSSFGAQKSLTSSAANYIFEGSAEGAIVVKLSQSSAKKALYVKSVIVTYETSGAPEKVLSSIEISGGLTKKTYEEGVELDLTGLTVQANYESGDPKDVTNEVEWSYTPNPLTKGTTSVEVTATYEDKTATKTINDLTVNEHIITPGAYDITLNNVFFGTTASANITGPVTGKQNDITITINGTGSTKPRTDATYTRFYTSSTMAISVPSGYVIKSIAITKNESDYANPSVTIGAFDNSTKTWTGTANSVTMSFSAKSFINSIKVTYAADVKYAVNITTPSNGTLVVKDGSTVLADSAQVYEGTKLVVTPTPNAGYVFESLTVDGTPVDLTEGSYTFNMLAADVTIAATFKENEKPDATLTLSKNGVEETFPGSWKQDDKVELPSITSDCVKEFVGWSADANCAVEPEYKEGDEYTLAETAQTLYAVYATVGGGGEATAANTLSSNGWANESKHTSLQIDENVKAEITGTGLSNSGKYYTSGTNWRLYQNENPNLTISTTIGELKSVKFTFAYEKTGTLLYNGTKLTSGTAVEVSGTSATFTIGNSSADVTNGQIRISKIEVVYTGGVSYSDYSTTCSAALANPTFSLTEGKYTEAKSVEIEYTEGTVYYTMDGTEPTASSTQYTGAIALNDCGEYTIKAIATSSDSQSDVVSATYTIKLPLTNSQAAPYTEAEAIAVYDGGCYDNQDVYVKGTVKTATFNSTYGNYTITLTNGFQFYRFLQAAETKFTEDIIVPGDVLVACGKLSKYNTTYQLAEGCYLVERIPFEGEKTDISNTEATAYTVDKAFELIADVSSDLTKEVYVKGLVAVAPTSNPTADGQMTYSISDNGENTGNVLKVYLGLNLNGEKFTSKNDVQQGDYVVVKGKLLDYNSTYELNKGNQLVQHKKAASITISDITMEVGETKTIAATITPDAAKTEVTYSIKENAANAISLSGNMITANAVGTATITATIATATDYMGKTIDFTVTVTPESTSDDVVILAELGGKWYAMKGAVPSGKSGQLDAIEVTYFNGILYNVPEEVKSSITWTRSVVDGKATFVNNGKYLKGGTSTDLTLVGTVDNNCKWMWNDENGYYTTNTSGTIRTFLYRENYNFKNYGVSQAGEDNKDGNYGNLPVVTAPVYKTETLYTIKATAENGTVVGAGIYEAYAKVTLTADPAMDYTFVSWTKGGEVVSTTNPFVFEATENLDLVANFQEITATTKTLTGKFSVGEYEYAEFATGNLQHNPKSGDWRFAKQQYQYVGEANINVGDDSYEGWIDMLGWSTNDASNNYGVNPNNVNGLYDGTFQDWGDLFSADENWSTLSADQWKYLLNKRTNASSLKQIARVGSVVGIMLFPDNWNAPLTVTAQHDSYFDVDIHNYTLEQWAELEETGALFLPAAGRRAGGYGNTINKDQVEETNPENLNGGHYKHYDNGNIYCYYWTSTINESTKDVSYLHNIQALGGDKYTIGTGAVWGEKGRYGQSVRLAKVTDIPVVIRKELTVGQLGTVCLPYNIPSGQVYGATFYTLAGKMENKVVFDEVTGELAAGVPYLFQASAEEISCFPGTTIVTEPDNSGAMKGTFVDLELTELSNIYYFAKNALWSCVDLTKLSVPANRAYVNMAEVTAITGAAPVGVRRITLGVNGQNTATGVDQVQGDNVPTKMIINGQLFILRGEKMYDAQGKLVK